MKELQKLIFTRKPGAEEIDIACTEEQLGARFPDKFRELIQLVNQAEIDEWVIYPIIDSKRVAKTWDDIVRNNKESNYSGLEDRMIFIAEDGTGDLLCFKVGPEGKMEETIYYFDHETEEVTPLYDDIEQMITDLIQE